VQSRKETHYHARDSRFTLRGATVHWFNADRVAAAAVAATTAKNADRYFSRSAPGDRRRGATSFVKGVGCGVVVVVK